MGGKVQVLRSIIGRYKIDRGMLRMVQAMEKSKEVTCRTHGHELSRGIAGGKGLPGGGGQMGKN